MRRMLLALALALSVMTGIPLAHAGGGPLGIDHRLGYDNGGIWNRSYQKDLGYCEALCTLTAASLIGGRTRFGRTLWQSVDAMAFSSLASLALKNTFGRERPSYSADPNLWFHG
ncbi:MAG: phosphatase PAP2 family protein, partial [Metallibacterium scheffleri]